MDGYCKLPESLCRWKNTFQAYHRLVEEKRLSFKKRSDSDLVRCCNRRFREMANVLKIVGQKV